MADMGHLILTRGKGQSVSIDIPPSNEPQRVFVDLAEIRGERARLGFTAARDVRINRTEVLSRMDTKPPTRLQEEAND